MKIGGGNNTRGLGDLLTRMQQAHREAEVETTAAVGAANVDPTVVDISARAAQGSPNHSTEVGDSALQTRLLETAARALDGAFESVTQIREAVLEIIVDQRYSPKLPETQRDQILHTMKLTIAQDPVFCREVDRMLMLAARQLASQG